MYEGQPLHYVYGSLSLQLPSIMPQTSPAPHSSGRPMFAFVVETSSASASVVSASTGRPPPTAAFCGPRLMSTSVDVRYGQDLQRPPGRGSAATFTGHDAVHESTSGFHPSYRPSPARALGRRFTTSDRYGTRICVSNGGDAANNCIDGGANQGESRRNQQRCQIGEYMQQRRVQSDEKICIPTDD
jgi:hypothetical protein